jgi:uracil-DNA glycosylase family 4
MANVQKHPLGAALQWHLDMGVDEALLDTPVDRTAMPELPQRTVSAPVAVPHAEMPVLSSVRSVDAADIPGAAAARAEAEKRARAATTLDELRAAIDGFDGLSVKKTATQMVFADGNPAAPVMLIGEAPGADEDRIGRPFVGASGQLLDKIFASIGLSRTAGEAKDAVYISNILNWRPPGNRTPSPAEVDIALPFIERHVALAQPKILIFCGAVAAKGLLGRGEGISKLRGSFHDYTPLTDGISAGGSVPALCTYHPSYLLRTPSQKKAVWADMLMLQARLREMGLR